MPFANEHSSRLQDPKKFEPKSFRRNDSDVFGKKLPAGVQVVWAKIKGKSAPNDPIIPQAIRFPEDKYTVAEAKKWLADNNIKFILFEPAKEETKESKFEKIIREQTDDELKKSLKEVKSWFAEFKKEDESECNEEEIIDVSKMVLREMVQRGKQKFHPENWKNEAIELYSKSFTEVIKEGIEIPERIKKFLSIFEEARHSHDKCMICSNKPIYEVKWANGMGHAWFCETDFRTWATEGDGKDDIDYVKEIREGKASDKFSENPNPNIWEELKKTLKENVNDDSKIKFALRWHWSKDSTVAKGLPASNSRYELLIDSGKDILESWNLSNRSYGNPLKADETSAVRKTLNIQTPDGKHFKGWLSWEGSIPAKESELEKVTVLKEDNNNIYIVKDNQGDEVKTKPCFLKLKEGQEVYIDQWNNIYTAYKGGASYGNLNESIPSYMEIKDSGTVEILEESEQIISFKFNGKLLEGYWIMTKEDIESDIWVLSKGQERKKMIEDDSVSITQIDTSRIDVTSSTFPIDVKFKEETYILKSTKNGKLLLNKD